MASDCKVGRARLQLCCSSVTVDKSQDLSFPSLIPLLISPCCQLLLKNLGWPSLNPIDFSGKNYALLCGLRPGVWL